MAIHRPESDEAAGTRQADRPARSPSVRLNPPPPALMRMINPVVRRVLSSPRLGKRIGAIMLLEFTGRRSRKVIRVPAALHMIDGVPVAFTHRSWRLNFTGGAPVTLTHRGQIRYGGGILLQSTPQQIGMALRAALDNGASPFVLGLKIARSHDPTIADLASVGLSIIQFDLDAAASM
jgi:hypothetical protein